MASSSQLICLPHARNLVRCLSGRKGLDMWPSVMKKGGDLFEDAEWCFQAAVGARKGGDCFDASSLHVAIDERLMTTDYEALSLEQRAITGTALLELFKQQNKITREAPDILSALSATVGLVDAIGNNARSEMLQAMEELHLARNMIELEELEQAVLLVIINCLRAGVEGALSNETDAKNALKIIGSLAKGSELTAWCSIGKQVAEWTFMNPPMRSLCVSICP